MPCLLPPNLYKVELRCSARTCHCSHITVMSAGRKYARVVGHIPAPMVLLLWCGFVRGGGVCIGGGCVATCHGPLQGGVGYDVLERGAFRGGVDLEPPIEVWVEVDADTAACPVLWSWHE